MDDKIYEAIGMLLRGLVWYEQSGGRTPEQLASQVRRSIASLSPEIAAEVEQDGAARVYAERWDVDARNRKPLPDPHGAFDPQEIEILLLLVSDRDAEEVLKHERGPVPEQLRAIKNKLKAQRSRRDG